jgi:hypothetical protein
MLLKAKKTPKHLVPSPTLKQVMDRTHRLKSGAQPGNSAMRNTHIKAALLAAGGPQAVHLWRTLWATGQITPTIAIIFNN